MVYNRIQVAFGALKRITGPAINYQYDVKQILVINGLDLPEYYVVDFCNEGDARVIPMTGTSDGVEIPDSLLQTGKPVKAYIVVSSGQGDIQTRYEVKLPVNTRPMRDDIHPTDPQQQQIDALVDALNDGVSRAETAAETAEQAVVDVQEAVERAETAADNAETSENNAATSASSAANMAGVATSRANAAASSAETASHAAAAASTSAGSAAQSASSASASASAAAGSASSAASSANSASASAGQAASSAQSASGSATQASGSAQAAANSASSASQSATNAANKAQEAASKATEAGNAKDAAVTAKNDAATAKNDAVTAKEAAETAQGKAEDAQAAAEEAAEEATSAVADKAPVIINTASGEIANFADGADDMPIKKLVGTIVPVQDLHGYENPWPAGGGKNKAKLTPVKSGGASYKNLSDNSVTVFSDQTAAAYRYYLFKLIDSVEALAGQTVSFSAKATQVQGASTPGFICRLYNADGTQAVGNTIFEKTGTNVSQSFTLPSEIESGTILGITLYCNSSSAGSSETNFYDIQLELGSTVTTFAPHENICPISGWTGANIPHTGKNLLDINAYEESHGYYNVNGVFSGSSSYNLYVVSVKPETTYTISGNFAGITTFWDRNDNFISGINQGSGFSKTFTTPANCAFVKKSILITAIDGTQMLELGSTPTEYEPFQGQTLPINWQDEAGTIYSGSITLNEDRSVDVVADMGYGQVTSQYLSGLGTGYIGYNEGTSALGGAPCVSVRNLFLSNGAAERKSGGIKAYCNAFPILFNSTSFSTSQNRCLFQVDGVTINSVATFISAVQTLEQNGSGLFVAYELATPQTYHLTDIGQLYTYFGTNNVWIDTGSITECDYPADTKLYIDNKIATAIANALNA